MSCKFKQQSELKPSEGKNVSYSLASLVCRRQLYHLILNSDKALEFNFYTKLIFRSTCCKDLRSAFAYGYLCVEETVCA